MHEKKEGHLLLIRLGTTTTQCDIRSFLQQLQHMQQSGLGLHRDGTNLASWHLHPEGTVLQGKFSHKVSQRWTEGPNEWRQRDILGM